MYLTYVEYTTMGGTLDETTFNSLEFEAEALVNWYTFNRLKNDSQIPSEVKQLIKYLISCIERQNETMQIASEGDSAGLTHHNMTNINSQSNDGVSVSYNVLNASQLMESLKLQQKTIILHYLQDVTNEAGHKLLYRGLYPGE